MPATATRPNPANAEDHIKELTRQLQRQIDEIIAGIRANANNLTLVQRFQHVYAASGQDRSVLRLLLEWYSMEGLSDDMRGSLLAVLLDALRNDAELINPRCFNLNTDDPYFATIYRGPKHYLDYAIENVRLVARLQQDNFTVNSSPKFIIAIPKSGSSLLGICLGNMVKLSHGFELDENPFAWRGYPSWWDVGTQQDWDLRPEIAADPLFTQYPGGVYKGHIAPTPKNVAVLELYKHCRYVLLARDPRDQLAAAFCMRLKTDCQKEDCAPTVLTAHQVHEAIGRAINDGSLLESLTFMSKWLSLQDPRKSILVTYEQIIRNPLDVLQQMSQLFDMHLEYHKLAEIYDYATPVTNKETGLNSIGHDPTIYPLGWTGHVGIYRKYFSDRNIEDFNQVFKAFCRTTPWGKLLRNLYPDLPK